MQVYHDIQKYHDCQNDPAQVTTFTEAHIHQGRDDLGEELDEDLDEEFSSATSRNLCCRLVVVIVGVLSVIVIVGVYLYSQKSRGGSRRDAMVPDVFVLLSSNPLVKTTPLGSPNETPQTLTLFDVRKATKVTTLLIGPNRHRGTADTPSSRNLWAMPIRNNTMLLRIGMRLSSLLNQHVVLVIAKRS